MGTKYNFGNLNRRDFLKAGAAATAALGAASCSSVKPIDSHSKMGNATDPVKVAIVQSSKPNAADLNYSDILSLVENAVDLAGGFGDLINNGDVVVLKPNIMCLWINSTEEKLQPEINGVTTDWRVSRAVVELVRRHNPDGKVFILEGSAFQQTKLAMDSLNYTYAHIPGVDAFVPLEDVSGYEEWDSPNLVSVTLPDGLSLYPDHMKPNKSQAFYFSKLYYEADVVISLPVLKNHHYTGITGAIKNVGIGSSPPTIYGHPEVYDLTSATPPSIAGKYGKRIGLNRSKKINHDTYYLGMWIHDYYRCRPVDFVVTDGLQGSQNGPDIPRPTGAKCLEENQMNMRLILAGRDALAVDCIHALVIGMDPYKVDHLSFLKSSGTGCMDPAEIRIAGKPVHEVKKPFAMNSPRAGKKLYKDFEPPELAIDQAQIKDDRLKLVLSVDRKKVMKVVVEMNGKPVGEPVFRDFEDISLEPGPFTGKGETITVYAYDHYLNCSRATARIHT